MCEVGNSTASYSGCWVEESAFLRIVSEFTSYYTKGVVLKKYVILQTLPPRMSQPESFSKQRIMITPTYIIFQICIYLSLCCLKYLLISEQSISYCRKLCNWYSSPNVIYTIKIMSLRLAENTVRIRSNINLRHIMVWEAKWKELNTGGNRLAEFHLNK